MQHEQVLKQLNFDFLTPRVSGGGYASKDFCYHVATFPDSI